MPIVDGLTSTKLIRSHESTHGSHHLSPRASLNGRVPIIAVSASLVEKERQTYIDAGFDGWVLKPISFSRVSELMDGIVDESVRDGALYAPGQWEKGGWFGKATPELWKKRGTMAEGREAAGMPDGTFPAVDGVLVDRVEEEDDASTPQPEKESENNPKQVE